MRNCRTNGPRDAPSASAPGLVLTSRHCASSRFETFATAMKLRAAPRPTTHTGHRQASKHPGRSGVTCAPVRVSGDGFARQSRAAMASISAFVCASVIPAFHRAGNVDAVRVGRIFAVAERDPQIGLIRMLQAARHHADIVRARPFNRTMRPTTAGSVRSGRAKVHRRAARRRARRRVFVGGKVCPSAGRMPRTSKKFAVTTPAATRSGRPSRTSVALVPVPAAIASNTVFRAATDRSSPS